MIFGSDGVIEKPCIDLYFLSRSSTSSSVTSNEAVHDLFDILEEDQDELKYTTKELNRYFEQGHLYSMVDEEDLVDEDSFDIQVRLDCSEK